MRQACQDGNTPDYLSRYIILGYYLGAPALCVCGWVWVQQPAGAGRHTEVQAAVELSQLLGCW